MTSLRNNTSTNLFKYKNIQFLAALSFLYCDLSYIGLGFTKYIFLMLKIIFCVWILFNYFHTCISKKMSIFMFILILYFLIYMISTIINGGDIFNLFKITFYTISLCAWIEIEIKNNNIESFIDSFFKAYFFWILLALLIMIKSQNGIKIYFSNKVSANTYKLENILTADKSIEWYILPAYLIAILQSYIKPNINKLLKKTKILIAFIIIIALMIYSSTTKVAVIFMTIYILLNSRIKKEKCKKLSPKFWGMLGFAIYLGITFFNIQQYFSSLILLLFGKDASFTGRTYIWHLAMKFFEKNPILGNGFGLSFSGNFSGWNFHNTLLDIMASGGLLTTIFFVTLFILSFVNLKRRFYCSNILGFYIFTLIITSISEVGSNSFLYYMGLILAFNCSKLRKGNN